MNRSFAVVSSSAPVVLDWPVVGWAKGVLGTNDVLTVRLPEQPDAFLVLTYLRSLVADGHLVEVPARKIDTSYEEAFPDDHGVVLTYSYDVAERRL